MSTHSQSFYLLHESVQRWIWQQNWADLREVQEKAIRPILAANTDVVISAATAAGKTEAAFLPACSRLAELEPEGIGILYISPLKALINDQYRRLKSLGEAIDIPITPWHGDVSESIKNKQRKNPRGVLLITPESLESMLLNKSTWCLASFKSLSYVIIDEFHAFVGTERGCQLQSLMHRLEFLLKRNIPRIALSATLGNMQLIRHYLRPDAKLPWELVESNIASSDLQLQLRSYINPVKIELPTAIENISNDLYSFLRGQSNLIFANSRRLTEQLSAKLSDLCEKNHVPNEFFPHHGSLSKEIREMLEKRLQEKQLPTSAICTMTLELGIDIGNVDSIAQVTTPHSVASLRQRVGRSGRRSKSAVLRLFIPEEELTPNSHIVDRLRLNTIQCIAMVNLLIRKWYEPASEKQYHFSTLVQQTLSVIGQYGGVRALQLWQLLCKTGPFNLVNKELYAQFLKALGEQNLITQTSDGQIVLGVRGERYVEHYSFYTAFKTPEEYRLENNGKVLGSIPIDRPLFPKQLIIFAGKRWQVQHVDIEKKLILLNPAKGGEPPKFNDGEQTVHDVIRKEMLRIYKEKDKPVYLDKNARIAFQEGMDCFSSLKFCSDAFLENGQNIFIFTWLGDCITNTVTSLLNKHQLKANNISGVIEVGDTSLKEVRQVINQLLDSPKPSSVQLANEVLDTCIEKHDALLPRALIDIGYGTKYFDVDGAWEWMKSIRDL